MGIVASGTALGKAFYNSWIRVLIAYLLGAVVHPIMLNHLLDQPNSFARAIRISAALNSGLLLIANLMMRARLPPSKRHIRLAVAEFARDVPYVLVVAGCVLWLNQFHSTSYLFSCKGTVHCFRYIFCCVFYSTLQPREWNKQSNLPILCPFSLSVSVSMTADSRYQLPIMNAASIVGRTVPAMFVLRCGIVNLVIAITISMAVLLYSLMVVKTAQGMISFAIIYGFIEGACTYATWQPIPQTHSFKISGYSYNSHPRNARFVLIYVFSMSSFEILTFSISCKRS